MQIDIIIQSIKYTAAVIATGNAAPTQAGESLRTLAINWEEATKRPGNGDARDLYNIGTLLTRGEKLDNQQTAARINEIAKNMEVQNA